MTGKNISTGQHNYDYIYGTIGQGNHNWGTFNNQNHSKSGVDPYYGHTYKYLSLESEVSTLKALPLPPFKISVSILTIIIEI